MTRKATAGGWGLSARFLAWARNNGHAQSLDDIAEARKEYKHSGADSSRYENLTDKELTERRAKSAGSLARLTAEATRRETAAGPPHE